MQSGRRHVSVHLWEPRFDLIVLTLTSLGSILCHGERCTNVDQDVRSVIGWSIEVQGQ